MSACSRSSRSSRERADEIGADEAGLAWDLGGELGEPLLGERVAIDPDQRAAGPIRSAIRPRVAAAADRAVDRDLPRPRVEQLDQLAGEHRDMRRGHVKQCRQGSLRCRGSGSGPARGARGSAGDPRPRGTRPSRSRLPPCRGRRSVISFGRDHHAVGGVKLDVERVLKKKRFSSRAFGDARVQAGEHRAREARRRPRAARSRSRAARRPRSRARRPARRRLASAARNLAGIVSRCLASSECSKVPRKLKVSHAPGRT